MQFGEFFIQSIRSIYQKQTAQLIVNGSLTEAFKIEKGTRQGCPLSPLLFILTLEVLLDKIRGSNDIKGIKIRDQDYRLRAFADDLVITLAQPTGSVVYLMDMINQYGKVSGFKVNCHKTKIITKNMSIQHQKELGEVTGFEIVKKVKYLGVYIMDSNAKLYKNNYEILWQKIQKEMENWKKLKLSLLGRIAAIKMNVLPRFLFLFQMIPILKKDANLNDWQKGLNKFIWLGKRPRVKLKIIQDVRERGGLKMPNLRLYYEAAALSAISDWLNLTENRTLNIESYDLLYGWHAYLLYDKKVDKAFKGHIIRNALLRVWKKYQYKLNYKIPMWAIPRHMIENINIEQKQDVVSYKELLFIEKGKLQLKSLDILKQERKMYTWFQYGQLQARWKEDQKIGINQSEENLVKQIRDQGQSHIKRLYNVLIEIDSETELVKDCMIKWAQNFQEPIMLETWEKIWVRNVKFTQAQNLRENFYKMFYRWHLDPKKLSCMYPNVQAKCWRCESDDATYYHIWWTCKKVKAFWIKIWWIMQNVLKKKIKFTPQLFLLGIVTDCTELETKLILNLITAARLLIAQYWKKDYLPTIEEWTLKVTNLAEMAKISAYLKDCSHEKYIREWRKWIDYIQNKYRTKKYQLAYE